LDIDPVWQPAISTERYRAIDIVRGLALFGVLMVNLLTVFRLPLLQYIGQPHSDSGMADQIVDLLVGGFLEFKALTIFSFLFGVGIAIQVERASSRGVNVRRFLLRRMGWLFVLGTAHLFLIWNGDILALYAVCGLLLLPFLGLQWKALALIGTFAIALPELVPWGLPWPSGPGAASLIAQARDIYASGGYVAILSFRRQETLSLIVPLLVSILPRTVGLMFWGVAAWRSGIVRAPERHRAGLARTFVFSVAVGGAITANGLWAVSTGRALWPALQSAAIAAPILMALAYVSGLFVWLTPQRAAAFPGLAATGQMALTNYLLQSIVLGFAFYGYGFGLFGKLGSAAAAVIGVVLYTVQVKVSRIYLERFRFGPFEWLWRSLAYGRRQPFVRHS
jgi:uncharacterized protein